MRKKPSTPREPCKGSAGKKRVCWARPGSEWCSNHDPAEAERRKAAGRVRHPRFAKAMVLGEHVFDRAKAPSLAHIVDRAMGIADSAEEGSLDPRVAQAAVSALRLARDILEAQRERDEKKRWAWEREEEARRERAGSTAEGAGGAGVSSPEAAPEAAVPPWMRPAPTN